MLLDKTMLPLICGADYEKKNYILMGKLTDIDMWQLHNMMVTVEIAAHCLAASSVFQSFQGTDASHTFCSSGSAMCMAFII